jgi:anaerobic magnesium-protoporphyrin IX monomethyl ester cyclase
MEIVKDRSQFKVLIVYPNIPLMLIPSLAIALFTKVFREQDYQLDLFDATYYVYGQESTSENRVKLLQAREFNIIDDLGITIKTDLLGDFRRKVQEFKPDLLVFSVVEDAFLQAVELLGAIDDLDIPHLIGGVFPTNDAGRCLEYSEVHLVGRGEGEQTVVEVAEAVRLGKPLHNIPGTWYRDENGTVHKNPQPALVNIDEIIPDFSLFEDKRFYRPMGGRMFKMMPVETYRGCPYACTYCNSPAVRTFAKKEGLGSFLRRKSLSVLHDELANHIARVKPEFVYFMDDSFLARPRKEIYQFCDMYEEFQIPFWFNTRVENCDPDILKRLKEVGCYRVACSIECGNEEFRRKVLLRNVSNSTLIEHFGYIADSGIAFSIDVMVGMPGETRELVMDSVELIRSLRGFDALTVSIFTPYHGTTLRTVAVMNGWLDGKHVCDQGHSRSVLNMPHPFVSGDEIEGLTATFPLYCYFPKSDWDAIRRAEKSDPEGLRIREHFAKIYREEFFGETQDTRQTIHIGGATGCRTNPKDSFVVSPKRLSDDDFMKLTPRS